MKKLFILSLFIICSAVVVAQEKTETTKVSTEVNAIVDNLYDKTSDAIKELSQALKVPAEHVYTVLVKQQVVRSVNWIIIDIIFLIFIFAAWVPAIFGKDRNKDEYLSEFWGLPVFTTIVFGFIIILTLNTIITGFSNPEYGAIKEIMSLL